MSTKGPWTAQEIQLRDRLAQMAKEPENHECADCTAKAPKWAVFNQGIFICIKCAGCHRNIGRTISKVKSINLDRWVEEQFDQMCGNEMANRILLAHAPTDFKKPNEHDDSKREKFIEKKYVKRLWAATPEEEAEIRAGMGLPVEEMMSQPQEAVESSYSAQQSVEQHFAQPSQEYQQEEVFEQPIAPIAPPQQMNIQNYSVPKVEDDLLDFFGTPSTEIAEPAIQAEPYVVQPPPAQLMPPSVEKSEGASNSVDDIMDLFNQNKAPKPQVSSQNEPSKSSKFDVSGFISNGQRNTYKPSGFDW